MDKILVEAKFSKKNFIMITAIIFFCFAAIALLALLILTLANGVNYKYAYKYQIPCGMIAFTLSLMGGIFVLSAIGLSKTMKLVVTEQSISGVDGFNRKVELPISKISAIAITANRTLCFTTSGGMLNFGSVINCQEVYDVVANLIYNDQNKSVRSTANALEDLKALKELLDLGVITQEEFDTKKKQLLGL